jgi:hypothetical protein
METARFAFVIDGEFAGGMETSEAHPMFEHMCAVMRSGPEIVEILPSDPNFLNVKEGWIYSNGTWSEPLPS